MAKSKASKAATRGWETRRAREAQDARDLAYLIALVERDARIEHERKRAAAHKGWVTRRKADRDAERRVEERTTAGKRAAQERSERAIKGWETRRAKAKSKGRTTGGESGEELPIDEGDEWEIEVGIDYAP